MGAIAKNWDEEELDHKPQGLCPMLGGMLGPMSKNGYKVVLRNKARSMDLATERDWPDPWVLHMYS
jgi:hypothetical protein